MSINIDPVIAGRIKRAWANLSADQQRAVAPVLAKANNFAVSVAVSKALPPRDPQVMHEVLLAKSALTADQDQVLTNLNTGIDSLMVHSDGTIWGTGKYQQLDAGWLESGAEWLEHLVAGNHPFNPVAAAPIIIPDDVSIAIAGDWGTGDWGTSSNPAASTDVRHHMGFLQPHLTIHLGDVYYSGTSDQEEFNLVDIWPSGSLGALTLNSNHEMYSGAGPYFQTALGNPLFALQQGCSFFALENANWVIVGLDSAYYADASNLYQNGSLGAPGSAQLNFLQAQAAKGKKVIVLTHHNGLTMDGTQPDNAGDPNNLWTQVTSAFPGGGPAVWYWGHLHAGAVYKPQGASNILCRCCGHGALPWGQCQELENSPQKVWYENRPANDPDNTLRVFNGFAVLQLSGPNLAEAFYDENGGVAWQSA